MNMLAFAINAAEKAPLSDSLTLTGIDFLCNRTKRRLEKVPESAEVIFARDMADFPVATHTDEANRQLLPQVDAVLPSPGVLAVLRDQLRAVGHQLRGTAATPPASQP